MAVHDVVPEQLQHMRRISEGEDLTETNKNEILEQDKKQKVTLTLPQQSLNLARNVSHKNNHNN